MSGPAFRCAFSSISSGRTADPPGCEAQLTSPALPKAQTRFQMDWEWDGKPTKIVSRSTDEQENIQLDRKSFIEKMGTNALFHYNAQQTWSVDAAGRVRNVLA